MGSPILVGLSKSRRVKPGAAAQHYIVLYCIVLYCIRCSSRRKVEKCSFVRVTAVSVRFVRQFNALGNPLLTVQYGTVQQCSPVWSMTYTVTSTGADLLHAVTLSRCTLRVAHLPADVACLHR